jgi:hypothetical protein
LQVGEFGIELLAAIHGAIFYDNDLQPLAAFRLFERRQTLAQHRLAVVRNHHRGDARRLLFLLGMRLRRQEDRIARGVALSRDNL